ncbi:glycosyltransferase family 4 protein [Terrabacter ginsenosidimutans]|uniref:glycosyltransferase family 4 protein n=1 Tax=Terrabacter ginsenosidimutans TaxID=490575 RepID=UPI0031EFAD70
MIIATIAREEGITGVHTHVRQLRRYLERSGETSELLTPHDWSRRGRLHGLVLLPLFGARVVLERLWGPGHVWWYRTSHEFFLRRVLQRRLAGAGTCTVYAQCPVAARAALAARSDPRQRVVLAVHFGISQADEWVRKRQIRKGGAIYRSIRRTERAVVPAVDGLVFVSPWAREALREWLPEVDGVEGRVVPNFVSSPSVDLEETAKGGDLVSVGNLDTGKNHRYLLDVLSAARRAGHAYSLDILGQGEERQSLLRLVDQLDLGKQVRLLGFRRDVQQRLPEYRAYVHASYVETSSLAIMEAMAAGLPILSSSSGALAELFDDPAEGRFWPLDDPAAAARILIGLLEDHEELARAGRAARRRYLAEYDADTVAPRLLSFLTAARAEGRGSLTDR